MVTIGVFSDWLKEQGREADGAAMAEGWKGWLVDLIHSYGGRLWHEGRYHEKEDREEEKAYEAMAGEVMDEIRKLLGLLEVDS